MNHQQWDGLDPARSQLRALVGRLDAQLVQLEASQPNDGPSTELQALTHTWKELVLALALGEEPALRKCPHCGRHVLRQATRCRYCMRTSDAAGAEA